MESSIDSNSVRIVPDPPRMASLETASERIRAAINSVLLEIYPNIRHAALNGACDNGLEAITNSVASLANQDFKGVRPLKFLDLPRELRDVIYKHVVVHVAPLGVFPPQSDSVMINRCPGMCECAGHHSARYEWPGTGASPVGPAISQASRQLRNETLSLFYELNTFDVCMMRRAFTGKMLEAPEGLQTVCNWLQVIRQHNVKHLKKVVIHCTHKVDKKALLAKDLLPKDVFDFVFDFDERMTRDMNRDSFGFGPYGPVWGPSAPAGAIWRDSELDEDGDTSEDHDTSEEEDTSRWGAGSDEEQPSESPPRRPNFVHKNAEDESDDDSDPKQWVW